MKKILALALAFVMTMGLASVAFAADPTFKFETASNPIVNAGSKDEYVLADGRYVGIENEDGLITGIDPVNNYAERGDTIYIMLTEVGGEMTAKVADKWKVKADWRVNGDLVDSVEIVYKKFAADNQYRYCVAIKTDAACVTGKKDLVGILSLYRTSPSAAEAADGTKVLFAVGPNAFATYGIGAKHLVDDLYGIIEPDSEFPVVKFKSPALEEEVITFEGVGEYEINLYEQGNLYLGFNMDFNNEISEKFPEAELEFVNFPGKPAFNKWGVFYLYADEDNKFVYEMKDGVISKVDATWDASMDAYRFAAKRFDTFIISDVELDLSAVNTPAEDETPKDNPATGR